MPVQKVLFMLIGPKGAGKTHIGTIVDRNTDITFLPVEPIWMMLRPAEDGWQKVEQSIDELFRDRDKLMIESLGIGDGFQRFHESLAGKYVIRLIRVHADAETCLARVRSRSRNRQLPIPEQRVMEYNQVAAGVSFRWALEIDNDRPASDAEILAVIRQVNSE